MPICSKCQSTITEGTKFCPECGSLIAGACTCGYQLTGGEKFCPGCGKSISSTGATPTPVIQQPQTKEGPYESAMYSGRLGSGTGEPLEPVQNRMPRLELQPGKQLGDNYRIIRKIGSGGFGDVYEVENLIVGEHQALKVTTLRQEELKSLVQEFRARNAIKQKEHILEAYQPEVMTYEGQKVVVYPMELAEKSLREWLNETHANIQGRLEEGLELIRQACQGVQSIHDAGMVHLDLKPENLLMVKGRDGKWVVKVTDFGLARIEGLGGVFMEDGVGTPAYMAPEQILAAHWKDVTAKADIYGIGMILYELLDGDLPYSGTPRIIKEKKLNKEIPVRNPAGPAVYVEIVQRAISRDVRTRFGNFNELLQGLGIQSSSTIVVAHKFVEQVKEVDDSTGKSKKKKKENKEMQSNIDGDMVYVEGGWFEMGNDEGDHDQKPVHRVYIDSFYIEKYPVTVAKYRRFCAETGKEMPDVPDWGWRDNDPMVNVTWDDAVSYAEWVGMRLPTEAEWEYAARGGNKSQGYDYSGSDNLFDVGWFEDNSNDEVHPVGKKRPNELGIYDMSGNVWEWCLDRYNFIYYRDSPDHNPICDSLGDYRVLRGGSFFNETSDSQVSRRYRDDPNEYAQNYGFRVAAKLLSNPISDETNVVGNIRLKTEDNKYDVAGEKITCPHCDTEFYTEESESTITCTECNEEFTIDENYKIIGKKITCPNCDTEFYTEESDGSITCPECNEDFTVDEDYKIIGKKVTCPHCDTEFYTEEGDSSVTCPVCNEDFTIDEDYKIFGKKVKCPHCDTEFYTEESDTTLTCSECNDDFTIDEKYKVVGKKVKCPHCDSIIYADEPGEITCTECNEEFTVRFR